MVGHPLLMILVVLGLLLVLTVLGVLRLLLVLTVLLVLAILRTLLGSHSCSIWRLLEAVAVVTGSVHLLMTSFTLELAHQHAERSNQ